MCIAGGLYMRAHECSREAVRIYAYISVCMSTRAPICTLLRTYAHLCLYQGGAMGICADMPMHAQIYV